MPSPPRNRPGYLAGLDGWRAIAILAVLWIHEVPLHVGGYSLEPWQRFGALGVILFFAISGVLISTRILEEEDLSRPLFISSSSISGASSESSRRHGRFWWLSRHSCSRGSCISSGATGSGRSSSTKTSSTTTSATTRWRATSSGTSGTLAVEEHFYLLISLAFLFIKRRRAWVFGAALLLLKVAQMYAMPRVHEPELRRTYWHIDMLLWPSLAAVLLRKPAVRAWAQRFLKPWAVFTATFVLCAVARHRSGALMVTVLTYLFTPWVIATMLHPQSWSTRLLETGPLRYIGRISYSIYLWHVLFFSRIAGIPLHARWLDALSHDPWKFAASFAVASASYYWIEKPFVRLGHRLAPPATPGRRELSEFPAVDTPGTVSSGSV